MCVCVCVSVCVLQNNDMIHKLKSSFFSIPAVNYILKPQESVSIYNSHFLLSVTLAHSIISHMYSSLFIIVIILIFMFSL